MLVPTLEMGSFTIVHVCSRSFTVGICLMRCALRIGVDRGRLREDLSRCAVDWPGSGLSGGSVTSLCRCMVALCRWDWRGRRRMGGAVPLRLAGRVLCG